MNAAESTSDVGASRREFIQNSLGTLATGVAAASAAWAGNMPSALAAETVTKPLATLWKPGDIVLFQGDSITDAGRSRDAQPTPNTHEQMGNGYAWLAASAALVDQPDANRKFFNRGISGHKVFQLAERWQADCLDIKPNVLSILIGVNDIWHALTGSYQGDVKTYEKDYHQLLLRTREALPEVKLVICEPFVLRCGAVDDKWFPLFHDFRAVSRNLAEMHQAVWVPFQTMFDRASQLAPPAHWAEDGVHPSAAGASLMAHAWLRAVGA